MTKSKNEVSENVVLTWAKKPLVTIALGSFLIAFCMFDYFTADYNLPTRNLGALILAATPTVEYFGFFLGCESYCEHYIKDIIKRRRDWYLAILGLAVILTEIVVYIAQGPNGVIFQFFEVDFRNGIKMATDCVSKVFLLMSASFRIFRLRSWRMLVGATGMVIAVLYGVAFGTALWPGFPSFGQWINNTIIAGFTRGFVILCAIGAVILCLRIIFGKEVKLYGIQE
jgi:hypothetical protein